jgi:flavin reductase (DIM6/NTAB) family NADH-FMN oxidoreductase RutF
MRIGAGPRSFHRVYFGEIVAAYADEDSAQRLREPAGAFPIAGP